jgi:ABC-2 type transport system ATP-binding protein
MESVEELCDHIALLDHSNKILEVNLDDIKREFKTSMFEVGLQTNDKELLIKEIASQFTIYDASFKSLEDDLKLNIQLTSKDTSTELIQYLSSKAAINRFVEIIPNANDIFIQAVNKNN